MAVGSAFTYSSIDSSRGDIRVLNIYPGNQADDLNLTFDIVRITDDSELDFEAVSYRWGSPNGEQSASLNGRLFTLTLSQDQMIRNLREAQNIRRVWIDALCINQNDIIERNGQVQLMRRIYSNARCVPTYLDYEVDESSNAYKKFLSFTSDCKLDDLLKEDISFWRQICNALKAEYFGRVWVQQEMSLAKQLTLQCRKTLMPMICLANFLETWNSIFPLVINGEAKIDVEHPLFDAPDAGFMNILQGVDTFQKERLDFITLLTRSGHLKCTDERDRIYGVMFLARNWCEGYLIANYSLPVSDAFREAMASYLQNYRSISFLENAYFSYEGFEDIEDRTPSWVPDWRKPTLLSPIPSKIESKIETPRNQEKIEYPLVAHTVGNVLYTTGIKITKVRQHYSNMLGQTGLLSAPIRDFWAAFNNIVQNATQPADPEARTRYLLWLLVDRGKIQPDPVDQSLNEVLELFTQYFNLTLQFSTDNDDGNAAPGPDLGELRNFLHEVGAEEGSKAGFMLVLLNRLAFNQSDRLMPFISEAGSIGLAPPHTEPGDELWLIPTCKCPIILRPKNGRHIVLGNSWHENDKLWEQCGGMQNFFTEGEEIGGYKIEALCLE